MMILKQVSTVKTPSNVPVPDVVRLQKNRLESLENLPNVAAPFLFLNQFSSLRVLDISSNRLTELDLT